MNTLRCSAVVVFAERLRSATQSDADFALNGRMSDEAIIGDDAKPRCAWANSDTALGR
jgi:hypothetical protein